MFYNVKKIKMARVKAYLSMFLLICAFASGQMMEAVASDLASQAQVSAGQSVKIGLHKSIVLKLPTDVNDVIVADRNIADAIIKSQNTAYIFAREVGQTNIFFIDANGEQIMNLNIEVAVDTLALSRLLQASMPGNQITIESVNNNVILGGTVANATESSEAERIAASFLNKGTPEAKARGNVINAMKIAGSDQVMLKVRMVEVQRDALKLLGVDLQTLIKTGKFALNFTNITTALPTVTDSGVKEVFESSHVKETAILKAMEKAALLKTLAEPNLTSISGQPAKFHAGGQIPYETCDEPSASNYQTCTVVFKDYGIELEFTPIVMSGGRINLKIKTSVSDVSAERYRGLPALNTRSAETVVELPSGGSMMLAGLIKDTTRQIIEGMPGLKTVPVLGALFRSRDYMNNQTELVVIVTPYLVGSVNEKELASPAEGFNTASDMQTILFGRLNKVYGITGKNPEGVYHGTVGFINE